MEDVRKFLNKNIIAVKMSRNVELESNMQLYIDNYIYIGHLYAF